MTEPDRKALIYVFDDDEAIRSLIRIHLQHAGYEVRVFEDAVEGGKAMLESPPDLLISDVNMPYMDGLEFLAAMKSDPRVARFLNKPLRSDDLLQAVQQVLSRVRVGSLLPGRD